MIKFAFPLSHPPSFHFSCRNSPHVCPVKSFQLLHLCRAQPRAQEMPECMVNPAIWRHLCLSALFEAVGWVMQPCTMRHEPSSTWQRWGISWVLPLPSIPGWLKSAWLILHPSRVELGSLWPSEGSQHLLLVPASVSLAHGFWRESTRLLSHEGR